jgi:hypothetical protein
MELKCNVIKTCLLFSVFTEQELDALMDRSDLVKGFTSSNEVNEMSGVFRRLDVVADEMKK